MSTKTCEEGIVKDSIDIEQKETKHKTVIVSNCTRLNIRKKPNKNAEVVTVVNNSDELEINADTSTADWYAVTTSNGVSGFCMKKFVREK